MDGMTPEQVVEVYDRIRDELGIHLSGPMQRAIEATWPLAHRAGRDAAARDIVEHADRYAPRDGNVEQRRLRRHLMIAVQVAGPKATLEEVVEAVRRGDYVACHLDEAGRSIPPGRDDHGSVPPPG